MAAKIAKGKIPSKGSDPVLEISVPEGFSSFIVPIAILISAVMVSASIVYSGSKVSTGSSTLGVAEEADVVADTADAAAENPTPQEPGTVLRTFETFTEYDTDICKEDGKPLVFLFSTTWCPHCTWISETFDSWAKENSDKVSAYHWELDTNDNTLTSDTETEVPSAHNDAYQKFNPNGSIPTFVFGCRYSRVGNGFESQDDLQKEKDAFDSVVGELLK